MNGKWEKVTDPQQKADIGAAINTAIKAGNVTVAHGTFAGKNDAEVFDSLENLKDAIASGRTIFM